MKNDHRKSLLYHHELIKFKTKEVEGLHELLISRITLFIRAETNTRFVWIFNQLHNYLNTMKVLCNKMMYFGDFVVLVPYISFGFIFII